MKAHEIMMISRNADDAIARAEEETRDVTQDWADEATLYRFDDGSVLAVSGPQLNAYDDFEAALADFPSAANG